MVAAAAVAAAATLQSAVGSRSHPDGDDSGAEDPAGAVVNGDAEVEKVKPKKPEASLGDPRVEKLWAAAMFRECLWLLLS